MLVLQFFLLNKRNFIRTFRRIMKCESKMILLYCKFQRPRKVRALHTDPLAKQISSWVPWDRFTLLRGVRDDGAKAVTAVKSVDGLVGGGGDVAPLDVDGVGHVVVHGKLAGTTESS